MWILDIPMLIVISMFSIFSLGYRTLYVSSPNRTNLSLSDTLTMAFIYKLDIKADSCGTPQYHHFNELNKDSNRVE